MPDDQLGGPQVDDAHFTGVVLRLNADGSTPSDNPFFRLGALVRGEIGRNIQVFSYGVRNSFGMAVDPFSGRLWQQENGEDAFDEINQVTPGMNGGWIQVMGPLRRVDEYKAIETTSLHGGETFPNLQQLRWGPERIADSPLAAWLRLFRLPGSDYRDPEFSLEARDRSGGHRLPGQLRPGRGVQGRPLRRAVRPPAHGWSPAPLQPDAGPPSPRLPGSAPVRPRGGQPDLQRPHGSESLLIGRDFGVVTDIETGANGNLFVVSLSQGSVYEIHRREETAN